MNSISRIARKELAAFFSSPAAFIFFGVFLGVGLFVFFWIETFFARNLADVRPLFEWMPVLLIFLVAALTMRVWSEERRMGTIEFLLTSPVDPSHLVLGKFLACTGFPECRNTRPIVNKIGVACPKCGGDIIERRSRGRGRSFYGCSKYPNCDFISNRKPLPTPCPECAGLMVESDRETVACTVCSWTETVQESSDEMSPVGG